MNYYIAKSFIHYSTNVLYATKRPRIDNLKDDI